MQQRRKVGKATQSIEFGIELVGPDMMEYVMQR
jgi:hypothetical protein